MTNNVFRQEVRHAGLHKYRVITAATSSELHQKVAAQEAQWNEQWERKQANVQRAREKEERNRSIEQSVLLAEKRTAKAEELQSSLETILVDSLKKREFSFNDLKDTSSFDEPKPEREKDWEIEKQPQRDDEQYNPKASFITRHSKKKLEAFKKENDILFNSDLEKWTQKAEVVRAHNKEIERQYAQEMDDWNARKDAFIVNQRKNNIRVDEQARRFSNGDVAAVSRFFKLAIDAIRFPIPFDLNAATEYSKESDTLVVDVYLPTIDDIPSLKKVTYVKSRNEFKETQYAQSSLKRTYESVIYQIVLRIVKCVFTVNSSNSIPEALILNGRVHTIDATTGNKIEPYVLSLSTSRHAFKKLNLESVDPKAWFRSAKGVSAASLAKVTPIAPIMQLNREDKRFIEGYEVESQLNEGDNLAAMDWQDFENLVRELFGEEFSSPGGEVKITRASRDGGVDAVAFDPDPIRGGKIIIQAKRYTNTVGVSAVRDLYGTVMNEGAMKGILVTTSVFGNDAYEFIKGKPLTLVDGSGLLYLLEKHGHKARIDLREAKQILGEQTK